MGVGHYAIGFVLNIKLFTFASLFEMSASILLMTGAFFVGNLGDINATFFYFVQGVSFALLGVVPIMIAIKLKRNFSV